MRSVVALEVTVDYGLYERADLLIRAAGGKLAEPEFTTGSPSAGRCLRVRSRPCWSSSGS